MVNTGADNRCGLEFSFAMSVVVVLIIRDRIGFCQIAVVGLNYALFISKDVANERVPLIPSVKDVI
jgi:hypothetical protein